MKQYITIDDYGDPVLDYFVLTPDQQQAFLADLRGISVKIPLEPILLSVDGENRDRALAKTSQLAIQAVKDLVPNTAIDDLTEKFIAQHIIEHMIEPYRGKIGIAQKIGTSLGRTYIYFNAVEIVGYFYPENLLKTNNQILTFSTSEHAEREAKRLTNIYDPGW